MTNALKPCPFCGSKETHVGHSQVGYTKQEYHHVECWTCCSRGPLSETVDEAIEKWQNRPPPQEPKRGWHKLDSISYGRPINCS